jgi:hypothetical protein
MNRKSYKIIFSSLAVMLIVAVFFLVDNFPSANAAIRVAEAEVPQEPVYDYFSDDSFQRYLSVDTPFIDLNYIPWDLLPVNSSFTANSAKAFRLREEA